MKNVWLLIVCATSLFASDACYDDKKLWLVVRDGKTAERFETRADWAKSRAAVIDFTRKDLRWFASDKSGAISDEVFLEKTGQVELAKKLSLERAADKRRSSYQLIFGIPLSAIMIGGGTYWGLSVWEKTDPSTLDMAGSIVIATAGIGVFVGVISSYVRNHRAQNPADHTISLAQAADIVERHNSALLRKCSSQSPANNEHSE